MAAVALIANSKEHQLRSDQPPYAQKMLENLRQVFSHQHSYAGPTDKHQVLQLHLLHERARLWHPTG